MVFLKPLAFDGHSAHGVYVAKPDGQSMGVGFDWIDHIERAPRVLQVGLAMLKGTDTQVEVVAIVDGWAAWVRKGYKTSNGWTQVEFLEPVDD